MFMSSHRGLCVACLVTVLSLSCAGAVRAADTCMRLSGDETSVVTLPHVPALSGASAFTVELWARIDRQREWMNLCQTAGGTSDSGIAMALYRNGIYPCARNGGNYHVAFRNAFGVGTWVHVAYVFDASLPADSAILLYINGTPAPVGYVHMGQTKPARTPADCGALVIGPFEGAVDEVRVWSAALPSELVSAWWWRPVGPEHPARGALVQYFNFDGDAPLNGRAGSGVATAADAVVAADPPGVGDLARTLGQAVRVTTRLDYVTDPTEVELLFAGVPDLPVVAEAEVGGGRVALGGLSKVRNGHLAAMQLPNAAPGRHTCVIRLLTDGDLLAERTVDVPVLRPVANQVQVDRVTGGLVVDGLPQIPFGFYCYTNHSGDDHPQPRLAEQEVVRGFTMMSPYQSCNPEFRHRRRAYLDRCAQLGMKVHINVIVPAREAATNPANLQSRLATIEAEVEAFRDHPALLAWYLSDEPELRGESPETLAAIRDRIRELDPYHPVTIVFISAPPASRYAKALDIVMTDPYPIPNRSPELAGSVTRALTATFGGRKPIWVVPQAFGGNEHWGREPTPQEERLMTYRAIMEGATGVQYFIRNGMNGFPKSTIAWNECAAVAVEVAQLTPDILSTQPRPPVTVTPETVRAAAWMRDGRVTVMVANLANTPTSFELMLPDMPVTGTARAVFENRTVAVSEGRLRDMIDAYGTRVYQVVVAPPTAGPVTLAERNVLRNPSFEEMPTPGVPSGSYARVGAGQGMSYFIDPRLSVHGRRSLRIHVPDTDNTFGLSPYNVTVTNGTVYQLSVWARGRDLPALGQAPRSRARLHLGLSGFDGPMAYTARGRGSTTGAGSTYRILGVSTDSDLTGEWQRCTLYGTARKGRSNVSLAVRQPGTVWVDALQLVPVDPFAGVETEFDTAVDLTIVPPEEGLRTHVTTDGSDPTADAPPVTAPVRLERTTTVKVVFARNGRVVTPVFARTFTRAD